MFGVLLGFTLLTQALLLSPDNVYKLFSLIYLEKERPYVYEIKPNKTIMFNFCKAFLPNECKGQEDQSPLADSYSFLIDKTDSVKCLRYSSNSYSYYFHRVYSKSGNQGDLTLTLQTEDTKNPKRTEFHIACGNEQYYAVSKWEATDDTLIIKGSSVYGCPILQLSLIWAVFNDNQWILGIVLFLVGFQLLFFGILTLHITIFITSFLICFILLAAIASIFLHADTSLILIYFSLLIIVLLATVMAYGLSKLTRLSVFFIGALLGFFLGMLVNSIFAKLFNIYSIWSLVVFQLLFTIPCGLLTFKFSDQIIILSTSLAGSYMIVRPISWLFGGFPNELVLYDMVESNYLTTLPWTFFLYLIIIVAVAILGAMYQFLKIQRKDPSNIIETNAIQERIEEPLDKIKAVVDNMVARYVPQEPGQNYSKMQEMDTKPKKQPQKS